MNPRARRVSWLVLALSGAMSGPLWLAAAPVETLPMDAVPSGEVAAAGEWLPVDPAADPDWQALFAQLKPDRTRQSRFEERRFFPFRKAPLVLRGEIRMIPGLGISLRYLEPEPRVLIVDEQGVLIREADGRQRAAPSDGRAQAATSALVAVLRFDATQLQQAFAIRGQRNGPGWRLEFTPREPAAAAALGVIVVSGQGGALSRIEMVKSATQRIEIVITETQDDVLFTAGVLQRFFR